MLDELYGSVAILNDVLPPEFQIEFAGSFGPDDLEALKLGRGNILFLAVPLTWIREFCGESAAACAAALHPSWLSPTTWIQRAITPRAQSSSMNCCMPWGFGDTWTALSSPTRS